MRRWWHLPKHAPNLSTRLAQLTILQHGPRHQPIIIIRICFDCQMIQIDPILPILHQYEYFSFLLSLSRNQHLYIALFCSILFMNRNMLVPSLYVSPYKLDQSLDLLSKNTVICIFFNSSHDSHRKKKVLRNTTPSTLQNQIRMIPLPNTSIWWQPSRIWLSIWSIPYSIVE